MNPTLTQRPDNIQLALRRITDRVGYDAIPTLTELQHRLSNKRLVELSKMWPDRARYIIQSMQNGQTTTDAFSYVTGMYDTTEWAEITSCLRRARGKLLCAAAKYYWRSSVELTVEERDGAKAELNELKRDLSLLLDQTTAFPLPSLSFGIPTAFSEQPIENPGRNQIKDLNAIRLAHSWVKKCLNDVPLIAEMINVAPSQSERAYINIEVAMMTSGVDILENLLADDHSEPFWTPHPLDPFGVGKRYAPWLSSVAFSIPPRAEIATHCKPDADALVAMWLAERFQFTNRSCFIRFFDRRTELATLQKYDCKVDVGRIRKEDHRLLDHKPAAFNDPGDICATRRVWDFLRGRGENLDWLKPLVDLVHDGDAVSRHAGSVAFQNSRRHGLHAHIACLQKTVDSDIVVYNATAIWLDALYLR